MSAWGFKTGILIPLLCTVLFLVLPSGMQAATVFLTPDRDATLYDWGCDRASGSGTTMFSGNTNGRGLRRAVVRFDVAGAVPPGSVIQSVSLGVNVSRSISGPETHTLHRMLTDWGEGFSVAGGQGGGGGPAGDGDATWCYSFYDSVSPGSSMTWTTAGGDFFATPSDSTAIGGNGSVSWSSAAMASDVQAWLDTPATNYGWIIVGNESILGTAKRLDSREHPLPGSRPSLVVTYDEPATPPLVTVVSPNGGETLLGNTVTLVDWTASDESGIAYVDIYLSTDNGATFRPLDLGVTDSPPYLVAIPNRPTTQAFLCIIATDNTAATAADTCDVAFTVMSPGGGVAAFTLRDFDLPGTQPFGAEEIVDPANCATCHGGYDAAVEPYTNWQGSMMALASLDPLFEAALAVAIQDVPDAGDLCIRCHMNKAWLDGRSIPTDGSRILPTDNVGVSCNFCHRLVDPVADPANPAPDSTILASLDNVPADFGTGMYVVDPGSNVRRGPFVDAVTGHPILVSPFHREAALCGTCHDVSNPAFSRVGNGPYTLNALDTPASDTSPGVIMNIERTYSEWFFSSYNTPQGVYAPNLGGNRDYVSTCQDCHMRDVTGKGCNNPGAPVRTDLPLHDLTGGNTWVPGLIASLYPAEVNAAAIQNGISRARTMLQNAAGLTGGIDGGQLKVTVTNNTGHKLPTGYPEGRRMWINVRFLGGGGGLLGESAAYDTSTGTLTHDTEAKIYEAEPVTEGIPGVPDDTPFHFVLNNKILKDNRIPPRGFTNAAFEAFGGAPVGQAYPDSQYWDDSLYDIPLGAVTAEVTLYYQTTSKEYVEFLRDENTTNTKGQEMYDLWTQHGKCPPEPMASIVVDLSTLSGPEPGRPVTALSQNFPNPVTRSTQIRYSLAERGPLTLSVVDVQGRLVRRLVDEVRPSGDHEVSWDRTNSRGQRVTGGVYYTVLKSRGGTWTRRLLAL